MEIILDGPGGPGIAAGASCVCVGVGEADSARVPGLEGSRKGRQAQGYGRPVEIERGEETGPWAAGGMPACEGHGRRTSRLLNSLGDSRRVLTCHNSTGISPGPPEPLCTSHCGVTLSSSPEVGLAVFPTGLLLPRRPGARPG